MAKVFGMYVKGLVVTIMMLSTFVGGRHLTQHPEKGQFQFPGLKCDSQGPFPYSVSLRDESNQHFCGGVLISSTTVATAASCLSRGVSAITLYIGGFDIFSPVEIRKAASTHTHPLWTGDPRKGHDIGVIKLDSPTCGMPVPQLGGQQATGQANLFLGFGRESDNGPFATSLLIGEFVTQSPKVCYQANARSTGWVSSSSFCTQGPGGNGGICEGDEGGPAVFRPSNFEFKDQLVGIASFVSGSGRCSDPKTFGVFTDVNHFASWLQPFL